MTRRFEMDPGNQRWAFFYFYDRYAALCRWAGWLTVIGLIAAIQSHNGYGKVYFLFSLLANVLFQALLINYYEGYTHAKMSSQESPYTLSKYAGITALGMCMSASFILGVIVTVSGY